MQCSKETLAWIWFFYNASTCFFFLLLFLYFLWGLFTDLFHFLRRIPILYWLRSRSHEKHESKSFYEEGEENESDGNFDHSMLNEYDHLVADILCGGETLLFLPLNNTQKKVHFEEFVNPQDDPILEEEDDQDETFESSPPSESSEHQEEEEEEVVYDETTTSSNFSSSPHSNQCEDLRVSPIAISNQNANFMVENHQKCDVVTTSCDDVTEDEKQEPNFTKDEKFLFFAPAQLETKKTLFQGDKKIITEEIFGDSTEVGSTSKSSSDWRSSIYYKDSGTEDPFSSSSRRSCPKWESYTIFQKYDEEMTFLDRISAQKLHETETFKSFKECPRSISERIVHKIANTKHKKASNYGKENPYYELEATYVAQICLTWEALNWNYKKFQILLASRREYDPGCPAQVAQQFQQFQVLLQRYNENEPYQHGKRPEIYARMRISAPKLLQVPEYRDLEDVDEEKGDQGYNSRISSASFLMIMEDGIRTFFNFLKADKEKHCQIFNAFFKRKKRRSLVDPILLHLFRKTNTKKKLILKELGCGRNCFRKRRLRWEDEIEILLGLIDLKVVSRVLRMSEMNQEQMHWCEEKMGKVKVIEGKLQRDSSPLFFPPH